MDWDLVLTVALLVGIAVYAVYRLLVARAFSPEGPKFTNYGDMTLETLEAFAGYDPFRPILLAVQGRVFNVTEGMEFYGRGGAYASMAGKECARALAKMSLDKNDFSADLSDCTEKEQKTLQEWIGKLEAKYPVVGQIVPLKELTVKELFQYNGSEASNPMYLAIRGVIFDVSSAPQYYGPDGIYPFAGHECARAFALVSLDIHDCTDNLEGLTKGDLDQLKEWEWKFRSKYPIVGRIVESK